MIKSSFGFAMPRFMPEHRLFANDLAGGGILDVGGYPVSMARLIAGAAAGKPFPDPDKVAGVGASRPDPASTNGRPPCCAFRAASSPRSPAAISLEPGQCAAHLRHEGPDRGRRLLVRRRQREGGTGKIDVIRPDGKRETIERQRKTAGSIPSRSTPPARRSLPGGRNSPGPA